MNLSLTRQTASIMMSIPSQNSLFQNFEKKEEEFFERKNALIAKVLSNNNYKTTCHLTLGFMNSFMPKEIEKLFLFKTEKELMIKKIHEAQGWKYLKKELKEGMILIQDGFPTSFESMRYEAVRLVIKICKICLKKIGFDPPGTHSASGTPGWNSDIDTVFFAPAHMPEEIKMLEKILFEMVMFCIFDMPSGIAIDTESYLEHNAETLKTDVKIVSEKGKKEFAYIELLASSLQTLRQCGGVDSLEWKNFKFTQRVFSSAAMRNAFQQSFSEVENLELQILKDMGYEHSTTTLDTKSLAFLAYRTRKLMSLSKKMDVVKSDIAKLEQEIKNIYKNTDLFIREKLIHRTERFLELALIKLSALGLLRISFFDEGYNTQGAFSKTCFNRQGQIHQRAIESFRKKQKLIFLSENQDRLTTNEEHFSAMQENRAMYVGHFLKYLEQHQGSKNEKYQHALVANSKYSERCLSSAYELIDTIQNNLYENLTGFDVNDIKLKIQNLWQTSIYLEQCKRKTQLNCLCAYFYLKEPLQTDLNGYTFQNIFAPFLIGGTFQNLRFEETITPEDFYLVLLNNLKHLGWQDSQEESIVHLILRACSGMSSLDYPHITPLIQASEDITLNLLQLTTMNSIHIFNQEIMELTTQIEHLSLEAKIVPLPENPGEVYSSLSKFWQSCAD